MSHFRSADAVEAERGHMQLDALVGRTEGAQPWRRLFHAVNGLAAAGVLSYTDISRSLALWILGGLLAAMVVLDGVRLRSTRANTLFFAAFHRIASPREATGPASSTWYALGLLLTVAFFSREAAISGILVLAVADPTASYIGRRWGRRPLLGASLEGTVVFFVVAGAVLLARHPWPVAVTAALVTALAERLAWPLDDNLAVPLAGAAAVTLLGMVL